MKDLVGEHDKNNSAQSRDGDRKIDLGGVENWTRFGVRERPRRVCETASVPGSGLGIGVVGV